MPEGGGMGWTPDDDKTPEAVMKKLNGLMDRIITEGPFGSGLATPGQCYDQAMTLCISLARLAGQPERPARASWLKAGRQAGLLAELIAFAIATGHSESPVP